MYNKLLGT